MSLRLTVIITLLASYLADGRLQQGFRVATVTPTTYELRIHRTSSSISSSPTITSLRSPCTLVSIYETQMHKDLLVGNQNQPQPLGFLKQRFHGDGYRHLDDVVETHFSFDALQLWEIATTECGPLSSTTIYIGPGVPIENHEISSELTDQVVLQESRAWTDLPPAPELDVKPLITSGPSSNRIDFVFFGDGYTVDEKSKFYADAQMLADDLAYNQTFTSVQPLMNFWAAFTPSKESGVGVGGKAKDTPFGLYRDGTELRAVYYERPEVATSACLSLGMQCDFPILLGNDPLYGGLGGEFTVVTASKANGALVLRHELGHSVIEEGEEYDGGFAYYGPNAANLTTPFPWMHWLSNKSSSNPPRSERSVMPFQNYAWTMLSVSDRWKTTFESSGLYDRYLIRFSLSGLPQGSDLSVLLDGIDLHWFPKLGIGMDRWHYDIYVNKTLSQGQHEISFELNNEKLEGHAQLCSVEILEFGAPDEFEASEGFIGAFPTYSDTNTTTYRPTNEGCLMRIVTAQSFCKVCVEGLWHALLRRVDLIDRFSTECEVLPGKNLQRIMSVDLLHLAQFRDEAIRSDESYNIEWRRNGEVQHHLRNLTEVAVDDGPATYTVTVNFSTEEVRADPLGHLRSLIEVDVPACK